MAKIRVELGRIDVRWGENPEMAREFTAQVARVGSYAGELIGSTRVLKVIFTEGSGLPEVEIERWRDRGEDWDVDYHPALSDDRKARRLISAAVRNVLTEPNA